MSDDPADGIVLANNEHGTWAWVAARIDEAVDLTRLRGHAGLSVNERQRKILTDQQAWLAGQHNAGGLIEVRYRTTADRLECAILGRVREPDATTAIRSARQLRSALLTVPPHVRASEITNSAEVTRWLNPCTTVDPAGLVEIRKRFRTARPQRPDAGVRYYTVVPPLGTGPSTWDELWRTLVEHPEPVVFSTGLLPHPDGQRISATLHDLATRYGRLARPGWTTSGVWSAGVRLAPDAFAAHAETLYREAARRYCSRPFQMRLTIASPEPLPAALVEHISSTLSTAPRDQRLPGGSGAENITVRPTANEFPSASSTLTSLGLARWDARHLRDLPEVPPPVLRLLAELVDADEASAVLRLPSAAQGHMPGFAVRAPDEADRVQPEQTGPTNMVQAREIHGGVHFHGSTNDP